MKTFILLAIVACAIATPIDDKSTSTPDISTLPLKKDVPVKNSSNSTQDSGVHSHPLHKRDLPPKVADQASGVNPKNSSSISSQKIQPSSPYTRVNREAQAPVTQSSLKSQTPTTPSSNYNPSSLYNQQRKPANVPSSQPIQPASLNPSAPRPLNSQTILSQTSRVRRDAPRVADQKSAVSQVTPKTATNQDQPLAKKPQSPSDNTRKTRDAPKPADSNTATTLNKKSQDQSQSGQKSDKPVETGLLSKEKSRIVRDAPNPVEQSKIVPSAHQPLKSNDDKKSSESTVTASPPLIAKTPQHKRESVPLPSSSDKQTPQFVHPVPVDQILKKPSTDSSSRSSSDSKLDSSNPASEIKSSSSK